MLQAGSCKRSEFRRLQTEIFVATGKETLAGDVLGDNVQILVFGHCLSDTSQVVEYLRSRENQEKAA